MRLNKLLGSILLAAGLSPVLAQDSAAVKKTEPAKAKSFADIINSELIIKVIFGPNLKYDSRERFTKT